MAVKDWLKTLFRETSAEIAAGALALGLAIGVPVYKHESARANLLPLAFSEKHQLHLDAEYNHETVPPFTEYLTSVNDATMKVFEAWNISRASILDKTKQFGSELEIKIDPSFNWHYYKLNQLLQNIPAEGQAAIEIFRPFIDAANATRPANAHFDNSWTERHIDHYHTEYYECGDDKHPQTCSREVYDNTTHYYWYHPNEGDVAATSLDALLAKFNGLQFNEDFKKPSKTNAEGEYAIEKTIKPKVKGRRMSPFELFFYSTTWGHGSTLKANLPAIMSAWGALHNDSPAWNVAKKTAHDESYTTGSHSDSGPREYQVADAALSHGIQFVSHIDEVVGSIQYSQQHASDLNRLIEQFISIMQEHKVKYKGLSKHPWILSGKIMSEAKTLYQTNFKEGLDVQGFRWYMVLLAILGGMAAGGVVGFWVDKKGDQNGWWEGTEERYHYHPFRRYTNL